MMKEVIDDALEDAHCLMTASSGAGAANDGYAVSSRARRVSPGALDFGGGVQNRVKKKAMPAALDAAGEELLAEVIAAGSPIPSGQLNDLAARVSAVNGEAVPAKMAMKRLLISNWVADHSDGDASAAAAAPAPAPVTNTPPGARPPNAPIDRKDVVLALRGYQGGDIPAASIADLTHSIEQLDGVKAPGNLRQRRTFLDDWYHANAASVPPEPPAAAEEEPPPAMEALPPRPAAAGVPPPLPTAASGGEEAALYSELSDALAATDGKLSAASVSNLALRLAELLGVEPPSLLVQRRRFLDDWHREKGGAAPGGGPYNSADYGGGGERRRRRRRRRRRAATASCALPRCRSSRRRAPSTVNWRRR